MNLAQAIYLDDMGLPHFWAGLFRASVLALEARRPPIHAHNALKGNQFRIPPHHRNVGAKNKGEES